MVATKYLDGKLHYGGGVYDISLKGFEDVERIEWERAPEDRGPGLYAFRFDTQVLFSPKWAFDPSTIICGTSYGLPKECGRYYAVKETLLSELKRLRSEQIAKSLADWDKNYALARKTIVERLRHEAKTGGSWIDLSLIFFKNLEDKFSIQLQKDLGVSVKYYDNEDYYRISW